MKTWKAWVLGILFGALFVLGLIFKTWLTIGLAAGGLLLWAGIVILVFRVLAPIYRLWGEVPEKHAVVLARSGEMSGILLPNGSVINVTTGLVEEVPPGPRKWNGGVRWLGNPFLDKVFRYKDEWAAAVEEAQKELDPTKKATTSEEDKKSCLRTTVSLGRDTKTLTILNAEEAEGWSTTVYVTVPLQVAQIRKYLFSGVKVKGNQKLIAAALLSEIRAAIRDYHIKTGDQGKKDVTLDLRQKVAGRVDELLGLTGIRVLANLIEVQDIEPPAAYKDILSKESVAKIDAEATISREVDPLFALIDGVKERLGKGPAEDAMRLRLLRDVSAEVTGTAMIVGKSGAGMAKQLGAKK